MLRLRLAMAAVAALLLAPVLEAQILDLTKRYQVIERDDPDELYRDITKAGQSGIRVVTGSSTGGDGVMVLLEKVEGTNERYEYFVVAASKPTDIERQLSHAGSQGYRLMPQSISLLGSLIGSGDIVMILEKGPQTKGSFQYLMLDASLGQTMQVTLAQSIDQGYKVLSMIKKKKQTLLVLEKPTS